MYKRILKVVLPLLIILAMLFPAIVAADTSLSLFSVVESGGTTYAELPIIAPISNTTLVAQGKIAANGLNTQVTLNGTALPHMVADDKTLFVSPILADTTTNFVYSSKSTPDTSMPIIVGNGGYVTTPYNVSLEPVSSGFNLELSGYIDTTAGVDKYILDHSGEITIQVTGNEQITATITVNTGNVVLVVNSVPNGYHALTLSYLLGIFTLDIDGTWTVTYNTVHTTFITPLIGYQLYKDWQGNYTLTHDAVSAYSFTSGAGVLPIPLQIGQRLGVYMFRSLATYDTSSLAGYTITDAYLNVGTSNAQVLHNFFFIERVDATGVTFPVTTVAYSQLGSSSLGEVDGTYDIQGTFTVDPSEINTAGDTVFGFKVSSDVQDNQFNTEYGLVNCNYLVVDYSTAGSITDVNSDWIWNENNVMPYEDSISLTLDGSEVLHYQPNTIIQGTVLPDLDSTENGVITWGTNPAGITVTNLSAPSVTTGDATNASTTSATLNGTLNNLGGYSSAIVSFEYGLATTPQTYPNTVTVTTPLTVAQPFGANITNLQPNATYHYQAIANVGSGMIVYGGDKTFTTSLSATSSTTVTISKVGVFQDYVDSGDLLFTAEIFCNYPPYDATGSAFNYFTVELLGTDNTTVIAVSPLQMWGDRPESIYLKPSIASTLTLNGAYHIAVIGLFSGAANPYVNTTIQPTDWKGSDKIQLDAWCIETAKDMEVYDNKASGSYVVSSTDNKEIITDTAGATGYGAGAGGYFTTGIPQISVVRPDLFQVSKSKAPVSLSGNNDQWTSNHVWSTKMGTLVPSDWNTFGALFGATGQTTMGYFLGVVILIICVLGVTMGGKGLPLLVLSYPIALWGAEMGAIGYQWLLIPCVAMVLLWARQFWVKPT